MTPPNRRCNLTAVSLFAGVGGFDLALQRAGVRVVAAVEIDPAARSVLARRFPDVTLFEDVREVTGDQLRAAGFVPDRGIITAGWPCQGNSVAGSRGGMADPRSGLWRHVVRLLADLDPAWFIGENVPGLLSVNGGDDFRVVLDDLARLGMGICWRILDAQHFGVPQRRRRVVIVGRAGGDARGPVGVLLEPEGRAGHSPSRRQTGQVVAALTRSCVGGDGGPDDNAAQAGHLIAATLTAGVSSTGVSRPGRRIEDDVNLVADTLRSHPRPGSNSVGAVVPVAMRGRDEGARIEAGEIGEPAFTLRTPGGGSSYPMIAHALTAEGADASEDGTGRGTPLVPMAFNPQTGGDMRIGYGDLPTAITTNQITAVQLETAVRRLVPLECERLQGFPDNWTAGQKDAPRYRQMGNAVAVPVIEWVTRRLVAVDAASRPSGRP
jgi:DNA (cytosine-5)-methyltransferase 1